MEEDNKIEFDISEESSATSTAAAVETPSETQQGGKRRRLRFSDVFAGKILASSTITKQLPLALMVLVYSFFLISNRYSIEKLTIENKQLQHDIDELRVRQIQNRCDYMNATMLTEVSEKLRDKGIKAGTTPSLKITIKGK